MFVGSTIYALANPHPTMITDQAIVSTSLDKTCHMFCVFNEVVVVTFHSLPDVRFLRVQHAQKAIEYINLSPASGYQATCTTYTQVRQIVSYLGVGERLVLYR